MNIESIKNSIDGSIPLILKYCRKLKIAEYINNKVHYDESRRIVSPGTAIESLIANILTNKKALFKVDEFYAEKDVEKYFGAGLRAENFNDDALGRSLDDLYSIDAKETFSTIAIESIKTFDIKLDSVHADTTSINVYGNYENQDDKTECIKLEKGHSKDHRPDLKQFMFGLACTKERAIITGEVLDGNTSDKTWNTGFIKKMRSVADKLDIENFIYVADSAAVTKDNLNAIADCKIDFVSLLPSTYNIEKKLKEIAYEKDNDWNVIGRIGESKEAASYKTQSFIDEINNRKYRFLVCHSNHLSSRKLKTLNSNIKKENLQLQKLIKKMEKNDYYCENDALAEINRFTKENKLIYHLLDSTIIVEERNKKRSKPGPPKGTQKNEKEIRYKIQFKFYENEEHIEKLKSKLGMFVLITSILDPNILSDIDVLKQYKGQIHVETNFKILKDPYFIDEIYLKTPSRIEALGYVLLFSLMVYTLIEREVRKSLLEEKEPLIIPGKVKSHTPTGKNILELLENIVVSVITANDGSQKRMVSNNLSNNIQRLLKLVGFSEEIYTTDYI